MSGWLTNGLPVADASDFAGTSLVPVDVQNVGGAAPLTVAVPVALLASGGGAQSGLTAQADNSKANATPLAYGMNVVTVVAGAADSVLLPPALPGYVVTVVNAGAASMQVFGQGTDTINGIATGTGVAQANGVSAQYQCGLAGAWFRILSA